MNFLRNSSLLTKSLYFIGLLFILLVVEVWMVQRQLARLEELHSHQNFARKAQLAAQEVSALTSAFINGDTEIAPQLLSRMDQHSHMLRIVGNGGRAEGATFLDPLSSLPAISFEELDKYWGSFQKEVRRVAEGGGLNREVEAAYLKGQWQTLSSWYDKLIEDLNMDVSAARSALSLELWVFGAIDLLFISLLPYGFITRVLNPIKQIEKNTKLHQHTTDLPDNELGKAAHQVNEVIEQLRDASEFVRQIGEGNLTLEYTALDSSYESGKNKLADSLIDMQAKLRQLNEEDRRRRWVNEGLTKFVEILRSSDDDIVRLGDRIMSTLTQYTRSNQGGLYLFNDEDLANPHLELVSLFAFDIKKYENRKVKLGEGLLGQTFLERETTYLTRVPDDYIRITSGLGEDNPRSLLIVPLKLDQQVFGVVELASFHLFEEYQINFVEKLGESIASTLSAVRSAQQTKRLLDESKSATEMMRAQEEEMRQNMEELQATQEEMARKERDYIRRIEKLEKDLANDTATQDLKRLRQQLEQVQSEAQERIKALENELAAKPKSEEAWSVVEDLDRTLRTNLEAVRIAHQAISNKGK